MADDEEEVTTPDPPPPLGVPDWMVTYGDMMSLLLCFFVLLFIFSKQDEEKYRSAVGSIQQAFGVQTKRPQSPYHSYAPIPDSAQNAMTAAESDLYSTVLEVVSDIIQEEPDLRQSYHVETEDKGIVLRISNEHLFVPGSAELSTAADLLLEPIIAAAEKHHFNVLVRTNVTNKSLNPQNYPSVWEFSGARAASALHGLILYGQMSPSALRSMGMGDSAPILPPSDPKSEMHNNRTEFLFFMPGKEFW